MKENITCSICSKQLTRRENDHEHIIRKPIQELIKTDHPDWIREISSARK